MGWPLTAAVQSPAAQRDPALQVTADGLCPAWQRAATAGFMAERQTGAHAG